ncbi:AAA family ATPase [Oceanihabitans sediminis]|uniref:Nicotinate-nucleotide adenylyltransferase n=1 Tax=Oceanihabitans sediminis TaxID=1812012 RepID=A0A368P7X6_9FLAO|nr:ATP-binding protein [Oceanihabitans sediminis]MDX1277592.1 ATP-binding protein [Oceanihabitans sediminis]MDX1773233.1 ATP-binding protein [Oceanihabitans sediminis]RBP34926.1 NadR type nicotinamide-nucleotide adenylyltransferase [Oceanihabitans sediminis]RCU58566.1 nicotinate-nucleotide adenylyltransferase [Oceanihabitans sediminis]
MEKKLKQEASTCIKVVLFGPESTGKTVLAKRLAVHYQTVFVPEYSREYAEEKFKNKELLTSEDVLPIAIGQMKNENRFAKKTDSVLICDTDLLETKVYSEVYYPEANYPLIEKYAVENTYDLYFLTYIDTPWEADGIRDKPNEREYMFQAFQTALIKYNKPYVLLKGDLETRFEMAVKLIDGLLNKEK